MAVIQANDQNFKDEITQRDKVIIKYYADWCGSCRLIAPKYKRLSDDERFNGVTFLDVNAEESPQARQWAGVTNLPFFAVVKSGNILSADNFAKEERILDMLQQLQAE